MSNTYYGGSYDHQLDIGGNSATIGINGVVKPNPANYTYDNFGGYAGVISNVNGASLTNFGLVYGIGNYSGVEFQASSTVVNYNKIFGGPSGGGGVDFGGGTASLTNYQGADIYGGNGQGVGVQIGQNASGVVTNDGTIDGGSAGAGLNGNNTYLFNGFTGVIRGGTGYSTGGRGGIGAYLNGIYQNPHTLGSFSQNYGYIRGGDGGSSGGAGGTGLVLNGAQLTNDGNIRGGDDTYTSANYDDAGVGVSLEGDATLYQHGNVNGGDAYGSYVAGGTGITLSGTAMAYNDGFIYGGTGGVSGGGGLGAQVGAGTSLGIGGGGHVRGGDGGNAPTPDGIGGAGGAGVQLVGGTTAATVTNSAVITGGTGGLAHANLNVGIAAPMDSGNGGDGVDTSGLSTLTNSGTITGGVGGDGSSPNGYEPPSYPPDFAAATVAGNGGIGVDLGSTSSSLTNQIGGAISGGNGGMYHPADGGGSPFVAGKGGVGVLLGGGMLATAGTISGGLGFNSAQADSIQFGSGANAAVVVESGAKFYGDIGGFAVGDKIDVTNLIHPGSSYHDTNSTYTLNTPEGALTFTGTTNETFLFSTDGSGGTIITIACYRRGTRILTERGEVAIESLLIGDQVTTRTGAPKPIRWIGQRSYSGEVAWGDREVLPILIRQGAIAKNVPARDLWVSPEHAMYIDGVLIPAVLLVNGVSIVQEERVNEVTYFHLEFDSHEVIVAEGALSESFVDDESRQMFDNAAEYHKLYPQATSQPAHFCAPRVEDGYELESVRQRLALRAGVTSTAPAPVRQARDRIDRLGKRATVT